MEELVVCSAKKWKPKLDPGSEKRSITILNVIPKINQKI
jgi:hypothetical protein